MLPQPGHYGALCQTCTVDNFFFNVETAECEECPESAEIAGTIMGLIAAVLAVLGLIFLAYKANNLDRYPVVQRSMRWCFGMAVALNPTAKAKIIYAFLQIVIVRTARTELMQQPRLTPSVLAKAAMFDPRMRADDAHNLRRVGAAGVL